MSALRQRLIKLAQEKPALRRHLVPLLREAAEDNEHEAGRVWDSAQARSKGQMYGPPYTTTEFKKTPPTNRGPGKCYYQTGKETDRCYVKRNIGNTSDLKNYNRKYRQTVLK